MSNLKLPTMSYSSLSDLVGSKWRVPLAYATHAERVGDAIYVKHHESVIAVIEPDRVWITNAGYASSTTANRLRTILRDNQIRFTVCIRQYSMWLMEPFKDRKGVPFSSETFVRTEAGWSIA